MRAAQGWKGVEAVELPGSEWCVIKGTPKTKVSPVKGFSIVFRCPRLVLTVLAPLLPLPRLCDAQSKPAFVLPIALSHPTSLAEYATHSFNAPSPSPTFPC